MTQPEQTTVDQTIQAIGNALVGYCHELGLDPTLIRPHSAAERILAVLTAEGLAASLHGRCSDAFRECPTCGQAGPLVDLVYTFEVCSCPVVDYPHLVEQIWHREHFAAVTGDQIQAALCERERLIADARREALAEARKAILTESRRGDAGAPGRQQITYAGGLRRASVIVDRLLDEVAEATPAGESNA